jgi:hypothetical protein
MVKKFLLGSILFGLVVFLYTPAMVSAQVAPSTCTLKHNLTKITGKSACTQNASISLDSEDAICCLFETVYNVVDWVFTIFLVVAVLLGLIGAYNILTSAGSTEKVSAGRNYIVYAIVGAVVALLARAIPWIIKLIVP